MESGFSLVGGKRRKEQREQISPSQTPPWPGMVLLPFSLPGQCLSILHIPVQTLHPWRGLPLLPRQSGLFPLEFTAWLHECNFLYIFLPLWPAIFLEAGSPWVGLTGLAHSLGTTTRMTEDT